MDYGGAVASGSGVFKIVNELAKSSKMPAVNNLRNCIIKYIKRYYNRQFILESWGFKINKLLFYLTNISISGGSEQSYYPPSEFSWVNLWHCARSTKQALTRKLLFLYPGNQTQLYQRMIALKPKYLT